jgi:DHA1 family tetracycline resistance protein-like MFS transporter
MESKKRNLGLIFFFVFIDLLGYSLILPLLPYYADEYQATPFIIGLIGTINAVGQLIAAPMIGRLSDRYGRRPLLIFSITGTVISFLLLGFANTLFLLILSRFLDGILGGNVSLARAYITDITDEKDRAKSLGLIGAAFGLGFIIGPVIGGTLANFGYNVPAFVAAGLSFINLVLVIFRLPESLSPEAREKQRTSPQTAFTLKLLINELKRPCVGLLLQMQLVYNLAFTLFTANFSLFAKTALNFSAQTTAYLLTLVGVIQVIMQGFLIGKLTAKFQERALLLVGTIGLSASLFLYAFTQNLAWMIISLIPISVSAGLSGTLLTSQLSKSTLKEDVGGTLGLSASTQTIAQIVCPALGGFLIAELGGWAVGVLAGLLMAAVVGLLYTRLRPLPEPCSESSTI